jgi:hypothetical protein
VLIAGAAYTALGLLAAAGAAVIRAAIIALVCARQARVAVAEFQREREPS